MVAGLKATPVALAPTLMVATTVLVVGLITDTLPEPELAT